MVCSKKTDSRFINVPYIPHDIHALGMQFSLKQSEKSQKFATSDDSKILELQVLSKCSAT